MRIILFLIPFYFLSTAHAQWSPKTLSARAFYFPMMSQIQEHYSERYLSEYFYQTDHQIFFPEDQSILIIGRQEKQGQQHIQLTSLFDDGEQRNTYLWQLLGYSEISNSDIFHFEVPYPADNQSLILRFNDDFIFEIHRRDQSTTLQITSLNFFAGTMLFQEKQISTGHWEKVLRIVRSDTIQEWAISSFLQDNGLWQRHYYLNNDHYLDEEVPSFKFFESYQKIYSEYLTLINIVFSSIGNTDFFL